MEQRLIDADALRAQCDPPHWCVWMSEIDDAPTIDAEPVGVLEQIRWERDTAMQQLEEHGIPFCGKADDVVEVCRCRYCTHSEPTGYDEDCVWCKNMLCEMPVNGFCSNGERRDDKC